MKIVRFSVISFLLLLLVGLCVVFFPGGKSEPELKSALQEESESTPESRKEPVYSTIDVNGSTYAYAFFTVSDASTISLIPNFTEKIVSSEIAKTNTCQSYINANFYDTNGNPLGLWRTGSTIRNVASNNKTFNGFFSVSTKNIPLIGFEEPVSPRFAIQTGPMLLSGGTTLMLRIQNDSPARRMVAVLGKETTLYFMTIFTKESTYSGPLLTDLPVIVNAIGDRENIDIFEAINLDGGSASAFSNGSVTLQEFSPIGSMICVTH